MRGILFSQKKAPLQRPVTVGVNKIFNTFARPPCMYECVATACSQSCVVGCTQYVFLLSNVLTSCPHICTTGGHLIGVACRSSVDYCCCGPTHPTHYPTIIQKGILKNYFIFNEIFWARPMECSEFTLPLTISGDN